MGSGEVPDAECARRDDEEPMIRREQAVEQQLQEGDETKDAMHRALVDNQHRKGLDRRSQEQ